MYNESGGVQSIRRAKSGLHHSDYYKDYLILPYLTQSPVHLLVLGSTGGTIPRLMSTYVKLQFSNMKVIDPEVIQLSYQYMGMKPEDADIVNQDARVYISGTDNSFDVIVVDCYSQQIYIPAHLSTVQFFDTLWSHNQMDLLPQMRTRQYPIHHCS
ncbi:fused MFS/spermidine synthase [Paenibacillus alvei]|uniref:spermidine synthase n=1 Tax=Paenibacillus alvei TaxID=44250 RepID=UPI003144FD50